MAVDRYRLLPAVVGPALFVLSACSGTIDSAVPGAWDSDPAAATDPSLPTRSPNGTPGLPGSNPAAPGTKPGTTTTTPGGTTSIPGGPTPTTAGMDCSKPTVGQSPLRRLTHEEYDNSVRDLLGATSAPGKDFATDTTVGLFDNTATTQTVPE